MIGVLQRCQSPRCLDEQPELLAPFVTEVSAAIRDKQLREQRLRMIIEREAATEPAHDRAGGTPYLTLRNEMEAAQARYIARYRTHGGEEDSSIVTLRHDIARLQADFFTRRERHEAVVKAARTAAVKIYWKVNPALGMDDTFFEHLPSAHAVSRVSRIEPAWWWRSFFLRLQKRLAKFHAAEGIFLDALPALRTEAKRKKLAGAIGDWCDAHREEWDWPGPSHYRMLADRAMPKARNVVAWFERTAPGYVADADVRRSLHWRLAEVLTRRDPLATLARREAPALSEHWRN